MTRDLVQSTVQVARAVFGARAASLLLHDAAAGELEFVAVSGEGAGAVTGLRISASAGIAGWVLNARQPIVVEDVASDPRYAAEVASISGYQPRGLMAAPLLAGDDAVGVLEVLDRPQRAHFSLIELDLLGLLAGQAALALAAERAADPDQWPPAAPIRRPKRRQASCYGSRRRLTACPLNAVSAPRNSSTRSQSCSKGSKRAPGVCLAAVRALGVLLAALRALGVLHAEDVALHLGLVAAARALRVLLAAGRASRILATAKVGAF